MNTDFEIEVNGFLPSSMRVDIFNRAEFFKLHAKDFSKSYYLQLVSRSNSNVVGVVHFSEVSPGHFKSPSRGTYGGYELERPDDVMLFDLFHEKVESFLVKNGAQKISIVTPPFSYFPERAAIQFNGLSRAGFLAKTPELNYAMEVHETPFLNNIDHGNRKQIAKAVREGLSVRKLVPSEYPTAYEVIVENRNRRGFPVTMTEQALNEMFQTFPSESLCFGAFLQETMIAASICFKVNDKTLYVFYWGDRNDFGRLSPVTYLAKGIYEYAQNEKIRSIDLGISTLRGVPNLGLIRYKTNLGCKPSVKLQFDKQVK